MKIRIENYRAKSRNQTITSHWRNYQKARNEVVELMNPDEKREQFDCPVRVEITAKYKGKRHVDTSNLDDKIFVDGLMHCGVIEDDRAYENPVVVKRVIPEAGVDEVIIKVDSMEE